ncbi:hypothetical protein LINPERHAP2_LOCUS19809 [Linum perenne]
MFAGLLYAPGNCSITQAEMRGAIKGLKRTWNPGYRRVIWKLDSSATIALLTTDEKPINQHAMETFEF